MKKLIRRFITFMIVLLISLTILAVGGTYGYIRYKMNQYQMPYTETVEQILMDMVPEDGIVIEGRCYSRWSVYNFLEEIRYDPYNYVHKDHHCILQYVPEKTIYWIVTGLRIGMGL